MNNSHWTINLGKGNEQQPDMRRVQLFSVELGVEIVLAGTVAHVSTVLFMLLDLWIQPKHPQLAEQLLTQLAACDFFDANEIIKEFMTNEHQPNGRANGTLLGSGE